MAGVAVLHPQDCLKEPFSNQTLIFSRLPKRPSRNPNPKSNNRTNRRKRSPTGTGGTPESRSPTTRTTMVTKIPIATNLVMGQVKILKRGEEFTKSTPLDRASDVEKIGNKEKEPVVDPDLDLTGPLGPDPETVAKQIGVFGGFYAGSAYLVTSPPPSSLPLPGFFEKSGVFGINKDATSNLLRILRLDLA